MSLIRIGIFGPDGRMGKDLIKEIKNFNSLELTFLCEKKGHKLVGKKISEITVEDNVKKLITNCDVVIDFTAPSATLQLLKTMDDLKTETALVTGTTGYTNSEEKKFNSLIKGKKVLRSFNMSIGINLLSNLVRLTSRNIGLESDIEITEIHHNKKRDIPSGTSILLAKSINEGNQKIQKFSFREKNNNRVRRKNEIGFASIRGGDVIGEHSVYFFLNGERIELKHTASNRKVFSVGALEAAIWIFNKKRGLYTIMDMVKT